MGMGMGMGGAPVDPPDTPEPSVPPTDITEPFVVEELGLCESALQFSDVEQSNLGGAGPDDGAEGITYRGVAPGTNLVVSATSGYTPNMLNPSGGVLRNGVRHGFGVINLASGSSVELTFTLKDMATGDDAVNPGFAVTFFDGDHGMSHESRESIGIAGFSNYIVDDDSDLEVLPTSVDDVSLASGMGIATFTSTLRGNKEDNPASPLALTDLQKRRSVTAYFENTASFTVTLAESDYVNPQGRNIFFAGASNLICSADAKCSSYECPLGWTLKQDAEFTVCATMPCTTNDNAACCFQQPQTRPAPLPAAGPAPVGMGMGMAMGMGMGMGMR